MIDSLKTTYNLFVFKILILFSMLLLTVSVYGDPYNLNRSNTPTPPAEKPITRGTGRTCLDVNCAQGQQCVMHYPPCRSEPCPKPQPICISTEQCNQTQCPEGQHCEMQAVVFPCIVPPCPGGFRAVCTR